MQEEFTPAYPMWLKLRCDCGGQMVTSILQPENGAGVWIESKKSHWRVQECGECPKRVLAEGIYPSTRHFESEIGYKQQDVETLPYPKPPIPRLVEKADVRSD